MHAQLYLTLCHPVDCSVLGSSIHGIFQARILEWVSISFPRGSSRPRTQTHVLGSNNIPLYEKQIYAPNYLKASFPFFSLIFWNVHSCPSFPIIDLQIWENSSRKPNLCPKKISVRFQLFSTILATPSPWRRK